MAPAPSFEGSGYPDSGAVTGGNNCSGVVFGAILPPGGSFPYVSGQKGGRPVKLPGAQGYRDADGNEWQWDPNKQEWDVQHPDGSHTNVGEDGEITHGPNNFPSQPQVNASAAAGAAGGGIILWWILKGASPLCGPAAPVCAAGL